MRAGNAKLKPKRGEYVPVPLGELRIQNRAKYLADWKAGKNFPERFPEVAPTNSFSRIVAHGQLDALSLAGIRRKEEVDKRNGSREQIRDSPICAGWIQGGLGFSICA